VAWFAQTSHGFRRGNAVFTEGGAFQRATLGDTVDGLVASIRDSQRFEVLTHGTYLDGLSGLTPGATYYLDAAGNWTTEVTAQPVFRAKSATAGWVFLPTTSTSGGSGSSSDVDLSGYSRTDHTHDSRYVKLPAAGGVLDVDSGNLVFDVDLMQQVVSE
jgi:hypothetical protein